MNKCTKIIKRNSWALLTRLCARCARAPPCGRTGSTTTTMTTTMTTTTNGTGSPATNKLLPEELARPQPVLLGKKLPI